MHRARPSGIAPVQELGGHKPMSEVRQLEHRHHGRKRCYWYDAAEYIEDNLPPPCFQSADIVIIGGGFAGLATACQIIDMKPNADILLIEANTVGYGASGRNGGLFSPLAAPIWLAGALRDRRQSDALRLMYKKAHAAAHWARARAPDAEMMATSLDVQSGGPLTRAGLSEVAEVIKIAGIPLEQNVTKTGCVRVGLATHMVHPFKLAIGLARYARSRGVRVLENTAVVSVSGRTSGAEVTLANGAILQPRKVVIATNAYAASLQLPEKPPGKIVRNFMVASAPLSQSVLERIGADDNFVVELNRKYIFYRIHGGRVIFGGIDKTDRCVRVDDLEIPDAIRATLKSELAIRLGLGPDAQITHAWGGRFALTGTDLPVIKTCTESPSVIYNLGYGGTGVALTLSLASVAASLVLEMPLEDDETTFLYKVMSETRLPVAGAVALVGHVANRLLWQAVPRFPN